MAKVIHRVFIAYDESADRGFWECDCGQSGTARLDVVHLAPNQHIGKRERRVDVHSVG